MKGTATEARAAYFATIEPAAARDAFDRLYKEGAKTPKMMSVGLHMRLIGHPARAAGLERLLDYIGKQDGIWVTRRLDIAGHWMTTHPHFEDAPPQALTR